MSGLLCLGPTAAISHEAAARLHGFAPLPDRTSWSSAASGWPRPKGAVPRPHHRRARTARCPDGERVPGARRRRARSSISQPMPASRWCGSKLDRLGGAQWRQFAGGLVGRPSTSVVRVRRMAPFDGARPGAPARRVRRPLDAGATFLALMRTAGLPRPCTQLCTADSVRTSARVDFCFEQLGVVDEVSGRRGHVNDAERARDALSAATATGCGAARL